MTHVSKLYFTQNTAVLENISSCANDINCRKYPYTKRMITVNQACRQYCNFSLNKPHADSRITKWLCKRNPLLRQKPFWWHLGSNKQACKLFLRVVCCNSEIRDLKYSRLKITNTVLPSYTNQGTEVYQKVAMNLWSSPSSSWLQQYSQLLFGCGPHNWGSDPSCDRQQFKFLLPPWAIASWSLRLTTISIQCRGVLHAFPLNIYIIIIIIYRLCAGYITIIYLKHHVSTVCSVAAIPQLQFMFNAMLFCILKVLYLYISRFQSMCAVQSMSVFCSSLISCFPGRYLHMLLSVFLNYFEKFRLSPPTQLLVSLLFLHSVYTV